jgi:UDP-N-acetylglucosamine 2-epimerase (non-hydrolysing)
VKEDYTFSLPVLNSIVSGKKKIVLITMHRRENWGIPMIGACKAIKRLAVEYPGMNFVFPVHLNPMVRNAVYPVLEKQPNVQLIEPIDYPDFVNIMAKSFLILSDSGGVQEEGPLFGIPILVLRSVTERPEAVTSGTVKLVGLDEEFIVETARQLFEDKGEYDKMAKAVNPYGDGLASERIVRIIRNYFGFVHEPGEGFIVR